MATALKIPTSHPDSPFWNRHQQAASLEFILHSHWNPMEMLNPSTRTKVSWVRGFVCASEGLHSYILDPSLAGQSSERFEAINERLFHRLGRNLNWLLRKQIKLAVSHGYTRPKRPLHYATALGLAISMRFNNQ